MHSISIVILGIAGMAFGWFVYSKFIANKTFKIDPDFEGNIANNSPDKYHALSAQLIYGLL
jgi:carbon starvation protein CstA